LFSTAEFREFLHRAFLWAMASRKPLIQIAGKTIRAFLPTMRTAHTRTLWPMPWLTPQFARRHQKTLKTSVTRFRWRGPLPTFQENLRALDGLRRQIACAELPPAPFCEKRYPFLDRDLLEFLYAVPREQVVRPGQRRSLMRRALVGITPDELLNRKRKAFTSRKRLVAIAADWPRYAEMTQHMASNSLGIVEARKFLEVLQKARCGEVVPTVILMRTIILEGWLRNLHRLGLANLDETRKRELALQVSVQG